VKIDIVDDTPYLGAAFAAYCAEHRDAAFEVGIVASSWTSFAAAWPALSNPVLFKAELRDHVPAALKVRALRRLDAPAIVVQHRASPVHELRLLREGAGAVIDRQSRLVELIEVIARVASRWSGAEPCPDATADVLLTDRELQIAALFCGGAAPSAHTLGSALGLSTDTVRAHLARARRRLRALGDDVSSRAGLRRSLIARGFLYPEL
jgi:DNA-binding CsgD family transcriptional regulator